jgi:hypothetical protein
VVGLSEAVRIELRGSGVESPWSCPPSSSTELAAGLADPRAFKPSTPEEVADAVVDALQVRPLRRVRPAVDRPTWAS